MRSGPLITFSFILRLAHARGSPHHVDIDGPVNGQGTDTALRAALAELLPELRAFARFLAGTKAEADDLVQEALARTLQSLDNAVEIGELRPWCFAVVRNVFHEHLRSRRREEARLKREITVDAAPATQEMSADVRDLATQAPGAVPAAAGSPDTGRCPGPFLRRSGAHMRGAARHGEGAGVPRALPTF